MNIKLYQLDNLLKKFLLAFTIVLGIGLLIGLLYLYDTTSYNVKETVVRYNGSVVEEESEMDIPESYPRPASEILLTIHNHVLTFSLIFAALGIIFYFNSIIIGGYKKFLLIEPFVSIILSFGGIWLMRFVHQDFIYLTVVSSTVLYMSFFIMWITVVFELIFKKARV